MIDFILANGVDPDEITPQSVAFHPGPEILTVPDKWPA